MDNLACLLDAYRVLLSSFWENATAIATNAGGGEWLNDWKQANWELIVEGGLGSPPHYLLPYGDGADYHGSSSRVFRPQAIATHAVHCVGRDAVRDLVTGVQVVLPPGGVALDRFVSMRDGWYSEEPPFDCALVFHGERELVISADTVQFQLAALA